MLLTVARLDQPDLNLDRYPIGALAYLEETGIDTREVRMAGVDFVGNLVDYVYGPEQRTFYDDRFDMFPEDISEAHVALAQGSLHVPVRARPARHRPRDGRQHVRHRHRSSSATPPGGCSTSTTSGRCSAGEGPTLGGGRRRAADPRCSPVTAA